MVNDRGAAVAADRLAVSFDDERLVANAGVLLPVTLSQRLGVEELVDESVDLGARPGVARPGRKVCSLIAAMLLDADSIDNCDVLRSGATERLLGHRAMAPSTSKSGSRRAPLQGASSYRPFRREPWGDPMATHGEDR